MLANLENHFWFHFFFFIATLRPDKIGSLNFFMAAEDLLNLAAGWLVGFFFALKLFSHITDLKFYEDFFLFVDGLMAFLTH